MSDSEDDEDMRCHTAASKSPSRSPAVSTTDVTVCADTDKNEFCLKTARVITVEGAARIDALKQRKFTKPRPWPYLMPFSPDAEADEWLNENILNLTACILIDDMSAKSSALNHQLGILTRYIGKYGLRFTKEQHCQLIRLTYGLVVRPKLNSLIVHSAAAAFASLVKGSKLTRADLVLDWRPIFEQYEQVILGKEKFIQASHIQTAIVASTHFFEKGAEKEIWKRIRPYIAPFQMDVAVNFVVLCLPSMGYEKADLEMKKGDVIDDHFLPVLWHFFEKEEMNDYWTDGLVGFFVRLTKDSSSAVLPFFQQHIHLIFTRVIRSLGLTAREGKVYVSIETRSYTYYGHWIGYMLGTHPSVEAHLLRLLSVVESHMHPSRNASTGTAAALVINLVASITAVIMKRTRSALLAKMKKTEPKRDEIPPLSEATITTYVSRLLSILVPALHGNIAGSASTLLGELAFLRPGLVIPKILDQLYPSLTALCEPERLTNSLAALKRMLILIASDRNDRAGYSEVRQPTKKEWLLEREKESARLTIDEVRKSKRRKRKLQKNSRGSKASTEKKAARVSDQGLRTGSESEAVLSLRPHLVYIAEALIDCIDINDTDKADLAYDVFTLLFAVMPIVDCSTAEKGQAGDCSEEERRLIQLSKRLKDIILKFVDKTFIIIDAFATNAPGATGLDSVGGIKDSDAWIKQGADESAMASSIANAFGTLFAHTDAEMGKILCAKVLHFARTSLFDNSTAAGIVKTIIVDCIFDHNYCVDDFLEYIVNEVGDVVDEDVQKAEEVDGKAAWLAAITPGFCFLQRPDVHDNFEDLLEMGARFLACKNKVMYEAGCSCIYALLLSLLSTFPMDTPVSSRFQEGRTPSKLWGATVDAVRRKQQWSHPVKADLEAAEKILEATMYTEMRRLAKPEGLSREQMRKSTAIILTLYGCLIEFLPLPQCDDAPTHDMRTNGLPRSLRTSPRAFHQMAAGVISFEGGNLRVALMSMVEGLITSDKCQDSQALECIVALIAKLERLGVCQLMGYSSVLINMLHNPLLNYRSVTPTVAINKLIAVYNNEPPSRDVDASIFECRVMRALFKLSFSLYDTVRHTARSYLSQKILCYHETTLVDEFIDEIAVALNDPRPEITKGALQLLVSLSLPASSKVEVRARVWPLLLKCRRPEETELLSWLDACYDQVSGRYHVVKHEAFPEDYLLFVADLHKDTPLAGAWRKIGNVQATLDAARQKIKDRKEKIPKMYADLSSTLHSLLRASAAISPSESTKEVDKASSPHPSDGNSPSLKTSASPTTATTAMSLESIGATSSVSTASSISSNKENLIGELKNGQSSDKSCSKSKSGGTTRLPDDSPATPLQKTPTTSPAAKHTAASPATVAASRSKKTFPPKHFPLLPPGPVHFHLRTRDLCIEMITLVENQHASQETMKEIFLPRLLEDRIEQRAAALDDLHYWLRKNKPKTAREQWACPPKAHGSGPITYGLRPDNIAQVYDSRNLPDTEQKWSATRFFRKTKGHFAWPIVGTISLPARVPIPLGIQMNGVDRVIVEWFSNRDNVHQLLEMTLIHLGDTGDTLDTDLLNIIYYLLRNYPDAATTRLLPPLREALEKLLAGKHVHEGPKTKASFNLELATQRLAAGVFLGIAKGTKYLPFNVLDELWKWMAPAVIAQLDHANFQATHFWSYAFEQLLTTDDMRRYWWLVEALIASFDTRKTIAPDERWKPANRLSLFSLATWRRSEPLNRVLSMAFEQLVPIATSEAMRGAIASLLGDAVCINNDRSEFFAGLPERFRVRSLDEYLTLLTNKAYKISRQASPLLLAKFDPSEDKENRRASKPIAPVKKEKDDLVEQIKDPLTPAQKRQSQSALVPAISTPAKPGRGGRGRGGRGGRGGKGEDAGQETEAMYARMLIEAVYVFYDYSNVPITEGLFKVLPLLCELAVDNEAEDADIIRENDILEDAEAIFQRYLACIPLNEQRVERMVETMEMIIKESTIATQRTAALKFLHVIVFSNIFLFDRLGAAMRERMHSIVLAAMVDKELPVRREASNCLCAFLHVGYFELTAALELNLCSLLSSTSVVAKQAGCLGFVAIVRAFPDQFTVKAVPALRELCRLSSGAAKDVLVQHWATNSLRDFRASHRDEWATDAAAVIGADLMFQIENELSPAYYV